MNKLGFYVEKTTDPLLRDALQKVKPPVVVIHAQDRGLLLDIRKHLSPDTFVIGRLFKNQSEQEAMLDNDHPEESGRKFADEILSYDFKLALERGVDDRLLIDAWMSLNELPPGPASYPGFKVDGQYQRRAEHYDRFQDAFRQRLESEGVDAVAFNFAAGNYIYPEHYLEWFPRTLENYSYLGFHEYGWPSYHHDPRIKGRRQGTCPSFRIEYVPEDHLSTAHPATTDHPDKRLLPPPYARRPAGRYRSAILSSTRLQGGQCFPFEHG